MAAEILPSEKEPLVPSGNVQSELFQAETNALLRELIASVEQLGYKLDSVKEAIDEVDRSVCRS